MEALDRKGGKGEHMRIKDYSIQFFTYLPTLDDINHGLCLEMDVARNILDLRSMFTRGCSGLNRVGRLSDLGIWMYRVGDAYPGQHATTRRPYGTQWQARNYASVDEDWVELLWCDRAGEFMAAGTGDVSNEPLLSEGHVPMYTSGQGTNLKVCAPRPSLQLQP